MNRIMVEGNVARDAEKIEYSEIGRVCVRWVTATERINPRTNRQVGTDYIPCQYWMDADETFDISQLKKGARVSLEGRLRIQWDPEAKKQYVHVSVGKLLCKGTGGERIAKIETPVYHAV